MTTGAATDPNASTFGPGRTGRDRPLARAQRNLTLLPDPREDRPDPDRPRRPFSGERSSRWLCASLLCVQGMAMLLVVQVAPSLRIADLVLRPAIPSLPPTSDAVLAIPLATLLALLGGLGFASGRRQAWPIAMAAQALVLLAGLSAFFSDRPGLVYPLLLGTIGFVLYLNSNHVRQRFEGVASTPGPSRAGGPRDVRSGAANRCDVDVKDVHACH